jgi:hypothetical protein
MLQILAAAELNLYGTISLAMPYIEVISYSDAWSLHGLFPFSLLVQLQQ